MAKVNFGVVETEVLELANGLKAVNALAHELVFENGEKLAPNPAVAKLVKASMPEVFVEKVEDVTFVAATPTPDQITLDTLKAFAEANPGIRVISSVLSVGAYRGTLPGLVISPITTPDTSRLPNEQKRIFRTRWNV